MLNKSLIIFTFLFWSFVPSANARIYDFAGIIGSSQEFAIDSQLISYEQATGVRLTVITTLYKRYNSSINDRVRSNEIVLLIAPDKKFCAASVGAGLKNWVTSTYASALISRNIAPAFDTRQYEAGVEKLIYELTNKIGWSSQNQREFILIKNAVESERRISIMSKYSIWILFLISVFLIFYFPISRRRSLIKSKRVIKHGTHKNNEKSNVVDDDVVEELVK